MSNIKGTVPTLTTDGWVTNKNLQLVKIFEYFLASDYSQSNTFNGMIASLKYIITMNHTVDETTEAIERTLTKLYASYYDTVSIIVDVTEDDDNGIVNYTINVVCTYDGLQYVLSKMNVKESKGNIINFDELLDDLYKQVSEE